MGGLENTRFFFFFFNFFFFFRLLNLNRILHIVNNTTRIKQTFTTKAETKVKPKPENKREYTCEYHAVSLLDGRPYSSLKKKRENRMFVKDTFFFFFLKFYSIFFLFRFFFFPLFFIKKHQ